jgi:hypothetical protein
MYIQRRKKMSRLLPLKKKRMGQTKSAKFFHKSRRRQTFFEKKKRALINFRNVSTRFKKLSSRLLYLRGVKMSFSGRMNRRNMMSKTEWYKKGPVPTQFLRSYVDYYNCTAQTKVGSIGIKVWLYLVREKDFF